MTANAAGKSARYATSSTRGDDGERRRETAERRHRLDEPVEGAREIDRARGQAKEERAARVPADPAGSAQIATMSGVSAIQAKAG